MPKIYDEDLSDVVLPDQGMSWAELMKLTQDERGRYLRAAREHERLCWRPKSILPKPANANDARKRIGARSGGSAGQGRAEPRDGARRRPARLRAAGRNRSSRAGAGASLPASTTTSSSNSLLPQPAFALASTLALLSALVGPKFMISELAALRLNLICVMVGPTGSGKDSPQKRVKELLASVSMLSIWIDRIGSYQGLEDKIFSSPHRFVVLRTRATSCSPRWPTSRATSRAFSTRCCMLYSVSNSIFIERALAEEKMSRAQRASCRRHKPQASLFREPRAAPAQEDGRCRCPEPAIPTAAAELRTVRQSLPRPSCWQRPRSAVEAAMNVKNAEVGLFGRFLFFPSDDRDVDMQFVVARAARRPSGDVQDDVRHGFGEKLPIGMTDEVRDVYRQQSIRKLVRQWAKTQRNPELAEDVCARLQENTFKIAGLLAVLEWAERRAQRTQETGTTADDGVVAPPLIGGEEFGYALELAWWCSTRFGTFVGDAIADADPSERNPMVKIRRFLRRQKGNTDDGWCNVRSVYKACNLTSKVAHENLNDMVANGEAEKRLVAIKGQSVAQVRLQAGVRWPGGCGGVWQGYSRGWTWVPGATVRCNLRWCCRVGAGQKNVVARRASTRVFVGVPGDGQFLLLTRTDRQKTKIGQLTTDLGGCPYGCQRQIKSALTPFLLLFSTA